MKNSVLIVGASFASDGLFSDVRRVQCMESVSKTLNKIVEKQYEDFERLSQIEFDGRYRVESDECFSILDYKDSDKTLKNFGNILSGDQSDVLKRVDDLSLCRALLFSVPEYPDLVLIQKFSNAYLAKSDRWLGFGGKDSIRYIEESAFTIGSSLTGFYDVRNKKLCFKSVQSIRSALPGFADDYVPGADSAMIEKFFSNACFESDSAAKMKDLDSVKVARLVWLLVEQGEKIEGRLDRFRKYNEKLNLTDFKDGKIVLTTEVRRMEVILRIFLGDVFEDNGQIYLSNSKKPLKKFD